MSGYGSPRATPNVTPTKPPQPPRNVWTTDGTRDSEILYFTSGRNSGKGVTVENVAFDLYHEAMTDLRKARGDNDLMRVSIEMLIDDLDKARGDGTIYTYWQVQERLREILLGGD